MNQIIFENPQSLAIAAAQSFQELALEAITTRGRFNVALAGGSTPKIIYEQLATITLPWEQIHLYWGDDRCVLPNESDSNYQMVRTALLEKIQIPYKNIHRVKTERNVFIALGEYSGEVKDIQFDLVHLGLGTDGHMASLFPATNLETTQSVQITFPTAGLEPQVQRITLSLHTINAALVKQFFVTGSSKQAILENIRNGADYPAARVTDAQWWLDQAASQPPAS
jgi:6-phosphogluconolactonase